MEITDLNKIYLEKNLLNVEILGRGFTWLDTGTHDSMLQASNFIQAIELNKGEKIACLEEIALNQNFISISELESKISHICRKNKYYEYVSEILQEHKLEQEVLV